MGSVELVGCALLAQMQLVTGRRDGHLIHAARAAAMEGLMFWLGLIVGFFTGFELTHRHYEKLWPYKK